MASWNRGPSNAPGEAAATPAGGRTADGVIDAAPAAGSPAPGRTGVDVDVDVAAPGWVRYAEWAGERGHTVAGRVLVYPALRAPQLGNERALFAYLPPSHGTTDRRFPVIYAQDGQNLFDAVTSYAGEWRFDKTMERLAREGREAIVVGIANAGVERLDEYSPFPEPGLSRGRGAAYVEFLAETVKPLVERSFRADPRRAANGLIGSSLGATISLFAFFERPDLFGFAGAMSPALHLGGDAFLEDLRRRPRVPGRLYLDVGTEEGARPRAGRFLFRPFARPYPARVRAAFRALARKGYRAGHDLAFVQERLGRHHEEAWARRLPGALRFLLPEEAGEPGR